MKPITRDAIAAIRADGGIHVGMNEITLRDWEQNYEFRISDILDELERGMDVQAENKRLKEALERIKSAQMRGGGEPFAWAQLVADLALKGTT